MSFPLASTTAPPSPLAGIYGAVPAPASHTNSYDDSGPPQLSSTQRRTASPSTDQQQQQQRLQRALQYDGALAALSSAAVLSNASAAANNNGSSPSHQQGALTPHTVATTNTNEGNYRPFFIDASDVARVHEVVESLSRRLSATNAQLSASVADRRAMGVRLLQCEAALQIVSAENARLHAYAEGYLAPLHAMQSEIVRRERAEAAALLLSAKEGARERERQLRREAAAARREAALMRGVMGASLHGRRLLVDVDAELEALRTREPSLFAGGAAGACLSSLSPTSSPHHAAALAPVSASVYQHGRGGGGGGASSSSISAAGWVGNGRADGGGGNARRKTAGRAASPPSQPQPSRSSSAAAAARRGRSLTPTRGGWRAGGGSASSSNATAGGGGVLGAGRPPSPSTSVRYGQQMYADASSLRRAVSAAGGPLAAAARDHQQQLAGMGVGGAGPHQQQQGAAAVGGGAAAIDFSLMDEDVLLDDFDLTPIPKTSALGGRRHEAAAVAASPKHAASLNVPTGGDAEDLLLADALSLSPQRQPQRAAALGAAKTNKQQPLAYAFGGANADGIRQFLSQRDDRIAALEAENSRLLQQVSSSLMLL